MGEGEGEGVAQSCLCLEFLGEVLGVGGFSRTVISFLGGLC